MGGEWLQDSKGLSTIGAYEEDDEDPNNNARFFIKQGTITGEAKHILTINEMPSHQHKGYYTQNAMNAGTQFGWIRDGGESITGDYLTTATGGGKGHNNVHPVIGVIRWHRIA